MKGLALAAIVCVITAFITLGFVVRIDGRLAPSPVSVTLTEDKHMSRTTSWTSALGLQSLTTTQGEHDPEETREEYHQRHHDEVVAAQLIDPPV